MLENPGAQAKEPVELSHALGVAAREVVVHRDQVDAASGEGVQVDGKRRDQGLALACRHLGDASFVEHHAADKLDVEVDHVPGVLVVADHELHPDHTAGRVLHHRKGFGEDLVQALLQKVGILDLGKLGLPGGGLFTKRFVWKALQTDLNLVDLGDKGEHPAHFALVL